MFNQYPRCRSRVYPPSSFSDLSAAERKRKVTANAAAPGSLLYLDHVFGSSGFARSIINVNADLIAFAASAAVVVVNVSNHIEPTDQTKQPVKKKQPQKIFTAHSDEVTCLCSRANLIASSELGFTPKVKVWNATTLEVVGTTIVLMERSVSCQSLAFINAKLLAAMTNDQNHSIAICNWRTGAILADARSGPSLSYGMMVQENVQYDSIQCTSIVSFGKRHLRFYKYNQPENTITSSSTSTSSDVLCGMAIQQYNCVAVGQGNGTVTFWVQNTKHEGGEGGSLELTTRSTLISTYGPIGEASRDGTAVTSIALCPPRVQQQQQQQQQQHQAAEQHQQQNNKGATTESAHEWGVDTVIFATGQADGCLMIHAMRLQTSDRSLVVSKLIKIPTENWGRTLSEPHRSLVNVLFNWNLWSRTPTTSKTVPKRPQKISMGTSGGGAVGKSAFMNKGVMNQNKKKGIYSFPSAISANKKDNDGAKELEPLLVVGTAGGSIFVVSSKEAPLSNAMAQPTTRWSGGINATCHQHSHGASVESCEQVDANHIVSVSRDGFLRVWNFDPERDRRCRAATGLPGSAVCVAVQCHSKTTPEVVVAQHAAYVGLADGRVVKVKLHYVSPEEQRKRNKHAQSRRQNQTGNGNGGGGGGGEELAWTLFLVSTLEVQNKNGQAMETLQCMSIRPDGGILAVGSRDNNIYLIDITSDEMSISKMLTGPSSFLLTIDWSLDGKYLQTNDASREILYFHVKSSTEPKEAKGEEEANGVDVDTNVSQSKQVGSASSMKDVAWSRWTSIFGWCVSGVWEGTSDATDVNTTCRGGGNGGEDSTLLVVGDDMRNVRLYNFPCLPDAEHVNYQGHHSHVMATRFCCRGGDEGTKKEWYVVSAGGLDRCVFLWNVFER